MILASACVSGVIVIVFSSFRNPCGFFHYSFFQLFKSSLSIVTDMCRSGNVLVTHPELWGGGLVAAAVADRLKPNGV